MPDVVTVAIDGPAGAGKSTVAKAVATQLGYTLVDTGAIYRAVALLAHRQRIAAADDDALERVVAGLDISFRLQGQVNEVSVGGEDVTAAIRSPEISDLASKVAAQKVVRAGLLDLQRRLAGQGGAVLEGRDIGTVVCPDAAVKIYLDASQEERARRRLADLRAQGISNISEAEVLAEVRARDARDMRREVAPLKPAPDARILDSTQLSPREVVSEIVQAVHAVLGQRPVDRP